MSSDPPPVSGSPYIIICSGRADIAAAKTPEEKALAACRLAGNFCAYMGVRYRQSMKPADMVAISNAQHRLMEILEGAHCSNSEIDELAQHLVAECYILEQKYTGVAY